MRVRGVVLLVAAAAGVLSILAALLAAEQTSLQCGLVTLTALVAYVMVAGRTPPERSRWLFAAGIGLLAVAMALQLMWYGARTGGLHLTPFYVADAGSDRRVAAPQFAYAPLAKTAGALLDQWRAAIDQGRIVALCRLLGVLSLAFGAVALPKRRRATQALLTAVLAVLLGLVAAYAGLRSHSGSLLDMQVVVWPALLASFAAVGTLAVAGRRSDRFWLLPVGALLVAVAAITALDDLAGEWSTWWSTTHVGEADALVAVGVSAHGLPVVSAALQIAVALAGPALLALGARHALRESGPTEARPEDAG